MAIKKPTDFDTTVIYSKNNCMKCKMTKNAFERDGIPFVEINIEDEPQLTQEYIDFLKGDLDTMAMPVVYPAVDMESWYDFRVDKIKELSRIVNA